MFEQLALNESTIIGAYVVLLVFGMLRYVDDIAEFLASLGDSPTGDFPEDSDST